MDHAMPFADTLSNNNIHSTLYILPASRPAISLHVLQILYHCTATRSKKKKRLAKESRKNSLTAQATISKRPSAQLSQPFACDSLSLLLCYHHTAVSALKVQDMTTINLDSKDPSYPISGQPVLPRAKPREDEVEGMIRVVLLSRGRRNYCQRRKDRRSCSTGNAR